MAKLKLALVHNSRTCTVRRQVDATDAYSLACGVAAALQEVANEHNIPGCAFLTVRDEMEGDNGEDKQKEPVPAAGGAGSGDDEGEE